MLQSVAQGDQINERLSKNLSTDIPRYSFGLSVTYVDKIRLLQDCVGLIYVRQHYRTRLEHDLNKTTLVWDSQSPGLDKIRLVF